MQRIDVRGDLREGLEAYAAKQAGIIEAIGKGFANKWHTLLVLNNIEI